MQNSEFVYFSSKSGNHMKQMFNPPFWGGVGVKKWSPFLDSGAQNPIFGHPKMVTFWASENGYFVPKLSKVPKALKHQFVCLFVFGLSVCLFELESSCKLGAHPDTASVAPQVHT